MGEQNWRGRVKEGKRESERLLLVSERDTNRLTGIEGKRKKDIER